MSTVITSGTREHRMPLVSVVALAGSLLLGVVSVTAAQPSSPSGQPAVTADAAGRWAAWLGCWQPREEDASRRTRADRTDIEDAAGVRVCITPLETGADGVTLTTSVGERVATSQTIVADGAKHEIEDPGCRGWQRNEWSASGRDLYSHAELTCGNEAQRTIAGLLRNNGRTWLEIQMIETGGRRNIRMRQYRRVDDSDAASARRAQVPRVPMTLSLADIKDAAAKLPPAVVEAAIVETGSQFSLNGRQIVDLDRAGVPDRIIDLMVALSYPDHFVIERTTPIRIDVSGGGAPGWSDYGGFAWFDPFFVSPWDFWSLSYMPFSYGYWGYYDPYFFPGAGFVTIGAGAGGVTPREHGRVVAGEGYTRVHPRQAEPAGSSYGWGGAGASGARSGADGGSASPAGYSGGGADSGRTAQPRNP